ncbi:hypothetical protein [Streptosporangium lutulentum]|uniref:Uncharacterized protein n=1 Tax=Streptosporangium lutulentum TaxID=1461250 RepID=A0ABT9QAX2_9ACTN|nr:hypothetical protein [Streptosporangium lutulentum]MDP9843084.1 hypothetical protein [Streptosporangium lutulentum]
MFEVVSALVPPLVVGGAFVAGIVWLVRSEARAKAAEHAERKSSGDGSPPE